MPSKKHRQLSNQPAKPKLTLSEDLRTSEKQVEMFASRVKAQEARISFLEGMLERIPKKKPSPVKTVAPPPNTLKPMVKKIESELLEQRKSNASLERRLSFQ